MAWDDAMWCACKRVCVLEVRHPQGYRTQMSAVTIRDAIGIDFWQCRALCAFKIHSHNLSSNLKTNFAYIWLFSYYKCSIKSLSSVHPKIIDIRANQTNHFYVAEYIWLLFIWATLMKIKFIMHVAGLLVVEGALCFESFTAKIRTITTASIYASSYTAAFFSFSPSYSIVFIVSSQIHDKWHSRVLTKCTCRKQKIPIHTHTKSSKLLNDFESMLRTSIAFGNFEGSPSAK